jgi:hypothetical protein
MTIENRIMYFNEFRNDEDLLIAEYIKEKELREEFQRKHWSIEITVNKLIEERNKLEHKLVDDKLNSEFSEDRQIEAQEILNFLGGDK